MPGAPGAGPACGRGVWRMSAVILEEVAVADDDDDDHRDAHQGRDGVDRQRQGFRNEVADQQQGGAASIDPGMRMRWSALAKSMRARCGTASPMKPTGPQKAVTVPASSTVERNSSVRGALHVEPHRAGHSFRPAAAG